MCGIVHALQKLFLDSDIGNGAFSLQHTGRMFLQLYSDSAFPALAFQLVQLIAQPLRDEPSASHRQDTFIAARRQIGRMSVPAASCSMVARGGIEPPTRGFSDRSRRFQGLLDQSLATLASPVPSLTKAQLRHAQSELVTFPAQRRLWPDSILGTEQPERSNDQTR
jgi:hypothetical protein